MTRLRLPEVMLCAVTSIAVPETIEALRRSARQVEFGRVVLLTDHIPSGTGDRLIEYRMIEPIKSRGDYSRFVLRQLATHVECPYILLVQWDGFVVDATQWRSAFLDYDYVGAVWPQFADGHNVGNGGFSLRSKRLLEITADPDFPADGPEDVSICRTYRKRLEGMGIRFAPAAVAEHFAFERGPPANTFGFHGLFNLPYVFGETELGDFLEDLDPQLLSGRDGADLIIELLRVGMISRAWHLVTRRRPQKPVSKNEFRLWRELARASLTRGLPRV